MEITKDDLVGWPNVEIALALMSVAIGSGDVESARICKEAARRLGMITDSNAPSLPYKALYEELLYAVATKHPGESRHETARRYIIERETPRPIQVAQSNQDGVAK